MLKPDFLPYVHELANDNGLPIFTHKAVALLLNRPAQEKVLLHLSETHKQDFSYGIDFTVHQDKIWLRCSGVVHLLGLVCEQLHWPEAMLILSLLNANQELVLQMALKFPQQSQHLLGEMQMQRQGIHQTISQLNSAAMPTA